MRIAVDIDGMLSSYPELFQIFVPAMQSKGVEVGILTSRPEKEQKDIVGAIEKAGIKMNFYVFKPDVLEKFPSGIWKAVMCKALAIDYLFDDFQHDDPEFVSDFTEVVGNTTIPFTTFHYKGVDGHGNPIAEYVKQLIEYLKQHEKK